jgi:hypothetical protein
MTMLRPMTRSPQKGAETLVWLATSPDIANTSGGYFFDRNRRPPSAEALDTSTARRLWEITSGSPRSRWIYAPWTRST